MTSCRGTWWGSYCCRSVLDSHCILPKRAPTWDGITLSIAWWRCHLSLQQIVSLCLQGYWEQRIKCLTGAARVTGLIIQRVNMKNLTRLIGYQGHTRAQSRQEVSCGKQTRKVQRSSHIVKAEHRNETVDFVAINTHFLK